ncbi:MAG: bifunctional [glutamine synthetase] adenylyltransferase/[glutamine synthetase]-adenylyl-L-tyrosine phosphorylase [Demequinaceae bacterium]|nr:bifunctional [glutamine synthetase] adenylyltransferase/[glutamine synthetase]-adenylyl-L-tyrosine phosphorylase [Demequinaceae bacterium]
MASRQAPTAALLRKVGVSDPAQAIEALTAVEGICGTTVVEVPESLAGVADPDLAIGQLLRLAESARDQGLLDSLSALAGAEARLAALLGGSSALGDFLVLHPEVLSVLVDGGIDDIAAGARAGLLQAVGADPEAACPVASLTGTEGIDALRVEYRRRIVRIAAEDLAAANPLQVFPRVSEALADLAQAALEAGLALARADEPRHVETRLAIIAMGKCGARELNYVSDVDVVYVAEPAEGVEDAQSIAIATRLVHATVRACDRASAEPALWVVDANLRPEGKDGALVRNVESHRAYYERWAHTWEFQALLKARPVAGDIEVGRAYMDAVSPMVWTASQREGFIEEAQAMRRRVEENVPTAEAEWQIKLGPGGLRDVEFTIQLLQLVHGRTDESLRVAPTLQALGVLRDKGYVGRPQASRMDEAYRQLRVWEHRVQLDRMRRTHLVPNTEEGLRRLARASGFPEVEGFLEAWHEIRRDVRAMHLEMFYRPLLPVLARLSAGEVALDPEAARERLASIGYLDPDAAQRHIAALTEGVSRRALIQRQLLPAMIGWFANGAEPDTGLLAFRTLSEHLGDVSWYLKLLRDSAVAAERLARLLSTSPYVTQSLLASAEDVTWLDSDEDLAPRALDRLTEEADAILSRADAPDQAIASLRGLRRRELARTAAADVLTRLDTVEAACTVTHVADVVIEGALRVAMAEQARAGGSERLPFRLAVVALGRYGGMEMSYPSDADVMFVYEADDEADRVEADRQAQQVAAEVRRLLQAAGQHPPLETDADLRPEGKNGPLARSLASCAEYYGKWSEPWEAQALLRARPVAGDPGLCERFVELIDPVRYPEALTEAALKQMRTLKARMESERLPRGIDPKRHVKLGPGGLSDVEWTVQLLQMRHAKDVKGLRTTLTLEALNAAVRAKVLDRKDATVLEEAWRLATRVRGAMALRGYPKDKTNILPHDARELRALTAILGEDWSASELDDRYSRAARRARSVMERVFYGWENKEAG